MWGFHALLGTSVSLRCIDQIPIETFYFVLRYFKRLLQKLQIIHYKRKEKMKQ